MFKITKYWRVALATATTLAFMAVPAHAGPIVGLLGTAISSIAAGASAAQVAMGLLASAVSIGLQSLIAQMMKPKEKTVGIKEKLESGGDNPLSFIMGECATAGKLVYVNQTGHMDDTDNNMLTLVISLSELPVTSFSDNIWINGELSTIDTSAQTPDGDFQSDAPSPGFFRIVEYDKREGDHGFQYCWVRFYDGTQTTADEYLLDTYGDDPDRPWTNEMVGRGCAYVIVVCRYSSHGVWSGIPEFKFIVRGIPLYDVRKDSSVPGGSGPQRWKDQSTWGFSENPKVMAYNAIRGIYYNRKWIWGGQASAASIPYPSSPPNLLDPDGFQCPPSFWQAAIAHCNENVDLAAGGTIKRYTAGCEITVDQQPIDIIKEWDKACNGYTNEYGGLWKCWAGPFGSSVFSFTDDNIIISEDQTDNPFRTIQETYNGARATYVKPAAGWVMKDAPPRIFDDLQDEDGGLQLIADFELPVVTSGNQAQRIMRTVVLDSRRQINHVLQLPPEAYFLEPFDVISWTSARNGYTSKKFVVNSIDDLPNLNQALAFRELNPDDYDWDTEFELPDSVGAIKPVKPAALALDFTVSPSQIDRPGGGKDKPAILVEWTWGALDIDLKWVKWEVRKSSDEPDVIAHGIFHNVEDNDRKLVSPSFRFKHSYQVRLFAQPERTWRGSSWSAWQDVTMVDIDIPGAPTLTRVSDLADDGNLDFYIDIDWTKVNADVKYDLKISDGTKTFNRHAGEENSFRLSVTSGKTYTVYVRAVAEDGGTVGDWSSSTSITVTKKNTAPTAPTSLNLVADFHKLVLDWNKSPDKDAFGVNIYRSNTNNFLAASLVHSTTATGWSDEGLGVHVTKYYWITFVDRSLNESAKFPASNTGGINGTTTSLTDSDTDDTGPNPPTSLGVSSRTDLNGDGKVDVELVVTFTGISNAKASYVIRVEDVAAGTFSQYPVHDQGNGTPTAHRKTIPCISGKAYNVSVASVSGGGAQGSYTANVNLTAVKKTAAPTAPTSLAVVASHKRVLVKANKSPDSDFKALIVYSSNTNDFTTASETGRVHSTRFIDDGLNNGETRFYWATFLDRSDNESAKFPTSNTAGVSATVPRIVNDDVGPGAVTPSKQSNLGDTSNIVPDPDMYEANNGNAVWGWSGGTLTRIVSTTVGGQSRYAITQAATALLKQIFSSSEIPVRGGKKYYVSGVCGPLTAVSCTHELVVNWYSLDASGNIVFISPTVTVAGQTTGSAITEKSGILTAPAGAQRAQIVANIYAGGNVGNYASDFVFRKATEEDLIASKAVNASHIDVSDYGLTPNGNFNNGKSVGWALGPNASIINPGTSDPGGKWQLKGGDRTIASSDPFDVDNGEYIYARGKVYNENAEDAVLSLWTTDADGGNGVFQNIAVATDQNVWTSLEGTIAVINPNAKIGRIYLFTAKTSGVNPTTYAYWGKIKARRAANSESIPDGAVTPRKAKLGDKLNMVSDPDCTDPAMWVTNHGPISSASTDAITESTNQVSVPATTLSVELDTLSDIPVKAGEQYFIQVESGPSNGQSANVGLWVGWYSLIGGVKAFISSNAIDGDTGTTITVKKGMITAPANARRATIISLKAAGGVAADLVVRSPVFRKPTNSDLLTPSAVGTTHIQNDAAIPSKVRRNTDRSNMLRDSDCKDLGVWFGSGGTIQSFPLDGTATEGDNYLFIPAASGALFINTYAGDISVKAGKKYYVSGNVGPRSLVTPNATYVLFVSWFNYDPSTDTFTALSNSVIGSFTGATPTFFEGIVTAPATANRVGLLAQKSTGPVQELLLYSPVFRKASSRELIPDGDVSDAKIDQTAPATPASQPAAVAITADIDQDGTPDTGFAISYGAIAATGSTPAAALYEVEIWRSTTIGTTNSITGYSRWKKLPATADLSQEVEAKRKWFHKFRYRGLSFANKTSASNWSAYTSIGIQPGAYNAMNGVTPSAPTVSPVANGFIVGWTPPTDPTYLETEILVGGTPLTRVSGNSYQDNTIRTPGNFSFTVRHYDRAGNPTNVSSATVAAYRQAQTSDIGTGQVTDGLTSATIATPSAPTVSQTSKDTNGDGTIDMGLKLSIASLPSGAYAIVFQIDEYLSNNTTFVDTYYVHPRKLVAKYTGVIAGHYYRVSVAGIGFNNHEGSFSSVTTLQATGKTSAPTAPTGLSAGGGVPLSVNANWSTNTDPDYLCTEIYLGTSTPPSVSQSPFFVAVQGNPALASQFVRMYFGQGGANPHVWIRHVNRSGQKTAWVDAGNAPIALLTGNEIDLLTVTNANIALNTISANRLANVYDVFQQGSALTTLGDVGTLAFMKNGTGGTIAGGATAAGSSLTYNGTDLTGTTAASGTWKALGRVTNGQATLFLRIS